MNRVQQMQELMNQCLDLFARKNSDYKDTFKRFGIPGIFVRMRDKLDRIINLVDGNTIQMVKDEKFQDTSQDFAIYALMAVLLDQEEFKEMLKVKPDLEAEFSLIDRKSEK